MTDSESHSNKNHPLSILYVDDEEDLLMLGKLFLERTKEFRVTGVTSAQEALKSSHIQSFDAIISDYQMPGMDGIAFLKAVRNQFGDIPFILFTGRGREEVVIEAINNGADFYLQKGGDPMSQFIELAHKIRQAVRRKEAESDLKESEEKFRRFAENAQDMLFRISLSDGRYEYISPASEALTGYTSEEYYANPGLLQSVIHPAWHNYFSEQWKGLLDKTASPIFEFQVIDRSGNTRWFNQRNVLISDKNGQPVALEGIVTDVTRQKNTERELQRSEQRFLAATLNTGAWVWEIDSEGIYTYSSPAVVDILGYRPDELVGTVHFSDIFDLTARKGAKPDLLERFASHESFRDTVYPGRHKNGSRVILKTSGTPIWTEDGLFSGYCGVFQDITTEKEAEGKLVESERRYRLLADHVHDVIWTADQNMRLTYISPSVFVLRGFTPEEVIDESFCDSVTPESFLKVVDYRNQWLDLQQKGRTIPGTTIMELEFLRKDRTTVWTEVIITPIVNDNNNCTGIVGIVRDITPRRQAEKALRDSEEKFRSFVENANEIVFSLNLNDIFTYISPKWTELLGYEITETIGKSSQSFIHPEDFPGCSEFFIRAIVMGEKISGHEYRIRHKNGSWQWHSQSISPVYDNGGKVIGVQGICHDITHRKKSEDALRKANRQLSILSGITRHDILNKISAIRGYLALVEMEAPDPAISQYLERMKSETSFIQSQIEFTRIYQKLGSHEPQWIPLDSVMPRSSLPDTITLTEKLQAVSIFADPMLEKVFFNLLDNSVRHGQQVTEIRVSVANSDGFLNIIWEDDGVGIAANEKEKIFERGFGKNTGLGMFLVREILALTDIVIVETGVPGRGVRFEIRVPKGAYRFG